MLRLVPHRIVVRTMLRETRLLVMNVDVIGKAYDIAANYLRGSGVIAEGSATNDRLLELIVQMFQRGETHPIRLANKAISAFESAKIAA